MRLTSENYDCVYVKHVRNIKKRIAIFCYDCILRIHVYSKSPHSFGYSLKALLFASSSYHPISKIIETIFSDEVLKTPTYDADELFLWYG